jgi:hydroxymethylpyrimidine pyrophosphatase-like HAD family hydrolase
MSRLFVSDLDGTLIQPDERLSDFAYGELVRMLGEGLPFTVASARSWASIRPIFDGVPMTLPVIEFNGTMATSLATGERRFCHVIDSDVVREAARMGAAMGVEPFVSVAGKRALDDALFPPVIANDGQRQYYDSRANARDHRLRPAGNTEEALDGSVVCLTFIERPALLGELKESIERTFAGAAGNSFYEDWYAPGWWWLTLQPPLGTKAHAVVELAGSLGVAMDDVTVFGDYANDVPMFEVAGRAVAVENASPELLPHADEVIGTHTTDSVVKYLAEKWDGR